MVGFFNSQHNINRQYIQALIDFIFIFRPVPSSMPSVSSQVDKADRTEVEVVTYCDELQVNEADRTEVNVVSLYS
jgi:hypothetical protein